MRSTKLVEKILTHERMKARIGDAIVSIAPDTPFTGKAIAKRSGFADSTVMIMLPQFQLRNWVADGPKTDDGRPTWKQSLPQRRGWEKYRESLRDVVEGKAIDVEEEARLRMHQLGLEGEWDK